MPSSFCSAASPVCLCHLYLRHYTLSTVFYRAAALHPSLTLSPSSPMSFLPPLTLHISLAFFELVPSLVLSLHPFASNLKPNCPSALTQQLVSELVPVCVRWEQVMPQGAAWPHCVTFTSVHVKLVCLSPWGSFKACVKCMDKQGRLLEAKIPVADFSQLIGRAIILASCSFSLNLLICHLNLELLPFRLDIKNILIRHFCHKVWEYWDGSEGSYSLGTFGENWEVNKQFIEMKVEKIGNG